MKKRTLILTADANFYNGDAEQIQAVLAQLAEAEGVVEALEERWLELEDMAS